MFSRFGLKERLPVVPGRLVQTGTELGIRLLGTAEVDRLVASILPPSYLLPSPDPSFTPFPWCLPADTGYARTFRCASSEGSVLFRRVFGDLFSEQ